MSLSHEDPTASSSAHPHSRKKELSEAELEEQIAAARRQLRQLRLHNRQQQITRLGTLAYEAGLARFNDAELLECFKTFTTRALLVLLTIGMLSGCHPRIETCNTLKCSYPTNYEYAGCGCRYVSSEGFAEPRLVRE